jgi:hypothetical protein
LILVDTSVWIDYLSRSPGPGGRELHRLIFDGEPLALTGIVVTEVLQGVTRDARQVEAFLLLFDLIEPRGLETYVAAAAVHRLARTRGIALSTVDALIAALAIEVNAALFSLDQDFVRVASITGLQLYPLKAE